MHACASSVIEMIPVWTAEGRKELSDDGCVSDWIKYSIRARAIRHTKKRAKERNEKEIVNLQNELMR